MSQPEITSSTFPAACWHGKFLGSYHADLPHWVVDYGCYSIMIRTSGSLPKSVLSKLREIRMADKAVLPQGEQALESQRRVFQIVERYLHGAEGFLPFADSELRQGFHEWLGDFDDGELRFQHWVIMPNHVHLLTAPWRNESIDSFRVALEEFKRKSGYWVNQQLGRRGPFWHRHGYDRWVRSQAEFDRWVVYFEENPVKAGLVQKGETWVGLR